MMYGKRQHHYKSWPQTNFYILAKLIQRLYAITKGFWCHELDGVNKAMVHSKVETCL